MANATRWIHIAGAFVLGLSVSCSDEPGEPVCGNGVIEEGEQCDNDGPFCSNCIAMLPATTTIRWTLNKDPVPDFGEDGCIDLGIFNIEVELLGGSEVVTMAEQCSLRQVVFSDLPVGVYTARLRPFDSDGNLLVTAPIEQGFQVGSQSIEVDVNIPPDAWLGPYTGSYFFHLLWEGGDCSSGMPPVAEQRVTMEQGGVDVPLLDSEGASLDGPCQDSTVTQSAVGVPFGGATIRIEGLDNGGVVQYDEVFETFVGAGVSNADFEFDLRQPMPDAGVPDAMMPDAMMPDAMMPDAMAPDAMIDAMP